MIGPGTGIAPFRGFWHQLQALKKNGLQLGKVTLLFGCRSKKMILYEEEVKKMQKEKVITNYFVAFSRESNVKKVRNHFRSNEFLMWALNVLKFFIFFRHTSKI
jgi:sulfite reductase alpha subunit-like flavoprotein